MEFNNNSNLSQNSNNKNQEKDQPDPLTLPLPQRLKHHKWSARKDAYQQLIYILKEITNLNQEFDIGGKSYKINMLIPLLQNLVDQKHPMVLIQGLKCVQLILILSKQNNKSQQFIKLIDKGIQIFPLFTQQRKIILQKFLDILELSQIDPQFLKNKLSLPHQKSVMYVAQVIGALNVTSLKQNLITLSKKHPKNCVRELCAQIAQEISPSQSKYNDIEDNSLQHPQNVDLKATNKKINPIISTNANIKPSNKSNQLNAKSMVIDKISSYQKLNTKQQQSFSSQLYSCISQLSQYSSAQIPNFSYILRIMIQDNNHIISTNGVKILTYLIKKSIATTQNSLISSSFPLLFIFNKFKLHKTHPVNNIMLQLVDSIVPTARLQDLITAIHQGLSSIGSKGNVKFGCAMSFFRILSLIYKSQDLFLCTTQNVTKDFENFQYEVIMSKNCQRLISKIIDILSKDKKYDNQIYLIRNAIGLNQYQNTPNQQSTKELTVPLSPRQNKQIYRNKSNVQNISQTSNLVKKNNLNTQTLIKPTKKVSNNKINLQATLQDIQKYNKSNNLKNLKNSLQKSSQEFFQCVRQQRYEMFYLCQLIQSFTIRYEPKDQSMQIISDYLINILKIISLLKPVKVNEKNQEISINGICFLLKISLSRLSLGEQILQILQNLSKSFQYKEIFISLKEIILIEKCKIKKKNKKYLIMWMQNNTPAFMLNNDYYQILQNLQEKKESIKRSNTQTSYKICANKQQPFNDQKKIINKDEKTLKNEKKSIKQLIRYQEQQFKETKKQPFSFPKQQVKLIKAQQKYYTQQESSYSNNQLKGKKDFLNEDNFNKNKPISYNYDQEQNNRAGFPQHQQQKIQQLQNIQISKIYVKNSEYESEQNEQFTQRSSFNHEDLNMENKWEYFLNKHNLNPNKPKNSEDNSNNCIQHLQKTQFNPNYEYQQTNIQQSQLQDLSMEGQKDTYLKNFEVSQKQFQKSNANDHQTNEILVKQSKQVQKSEIRQFFDRMKSQFNININQSYHIDNQQNAKTKNTFQKQFKLKNQIVQQVQTQKNNQQKLIKNIQTQKKQEFSSKAQDIYFRQPHNEVNQQKIESSFSEESIITDSTTQFSYRFINAQKISYMLQNTASPYPHLRTLILIPFKSSPKKPSFLKELLHFMQELNFQKFKTSKPFEAIVLLTILLFSEIKQDKGLISPLQSLYEFVAKQSSTNQFLKTIVSLFHSVIQETLPQNRKFLITILLKSMIRIIPFVQNSLQLLRDIQQFYQIGEMVYFQMFEEQYAQIKEYLEGEALQIVIQKALLKQQEQNSSSIRLIIQGFMTTEFKKRALQKIDEFKNQESVHEYSIIDKEQEDEQIEQDQQEY